MVGIGGSRVFEKFIFHLNDMLLIKTKKMYYLGRYLPRSQVYRITESGRLLRQVGILYEMPKLGKFFNDMPHWLQVSRYLPIRHYSLLGYIYIKFISVPSWVSTVHSVKQSLFIFYLFLVPCLTGLSRYLPDLCKYDKYI